MSNKLTIFNNKCTYHKDNKIIHLIIELKKSFNQKENNLKNNFNDV